VNSQVVPAYDDLSLPAVAEYRLLMDRHNPPVPEALRDPNYSAQRYSFISLEGFVNAKVVVEALTRTGPYPTRMAFRQALESMRSFDVGIGAPVSFGPERHQGLDSVYFTRVDSARWVPITDWASAISA
jgi:branched-chain amino acid transport system substrate-binding protein